MKAKAGEINAQIVFHVISYVVLVIILMLSVIHYFDDEFIFVFPLRHISWGHNNIPLGRPKRLLLLFFVAS